MVYFPLINDGYCKVLPNAFWGIHLIGLNSFYIYGLLTVYKYLRTFYTTATDSNRQRHHHTVKAATATTQSTKF